MDDSEYIYLYKLSRKNVEVTLASSGEVRVALVTMVAVAYVAGGGVVEPPVGAGGGSAGAVAAVARRAAQVPGARLGPSTAAAAPPPSLQHEGVGSHLPVQPGLLGEQVAAGARGRLGLGPVPGQASPCPWLHDHLPGAEAHGGGVQRDAGDEVYVGAEPEDQPRRPVAAGGVAGELEGLVQVAPGLDAEGVGHAHAAADGRAVGPQPVPGHVAMAAAAAATRRRQHQEQQLHANGSRRAACCIQLDETSLTTMLIPTAVVHGLHGRLQQQRL